MQKAIMLGIKFGCPKLKATEAHAEKSVSINVHETKTRLNFQGFHTFLHLH
jgi:hypothetical protein